MNQERVLTDNAGEKITVRWDGERFALVHQLKMPDDASIKTILLNPKEMYALIKFAGSLGKE